MGLFDLHCDTIEKLKKQGEDYLNCTTQFSLRDREKFQKTVQVVAVFVPDDIREREAVQFVLDYHQYTDDQTRRTGGQVKLVKRVADLDRILNEGKWAFIRSIESGAALDGDLDNIDRFAGLNFKMLGLARNGANELGSGPNNDTGLTAFGKEAVERVKQVGMIVDCSHLNDAGFEDLLNIAERPFVVSHSNVRACCSHPRNLTDTQFREIVRRGGLHGPNLFSRLIDNDGSSNKDYLLHRIYHMLELGGEDAITWGGSMDGEITCDPNLNTPYGVGRLTDYLVEHGIEEAAVQKIFFDNAYWFFKQQVKWRSERKCNMETISLNTNGVCQELAVGKNWTLLKTLRDGLRPTETKCGYETGDCGACMVIINGITIHSCLVKTVNLEGKAIGTIEGLSDSIHLHPIQQTSVDAGVVQYGFCIPGMIMSTEALLDQNPDPKEGEVRKAINPNPCHCTGYNNMIKATLLTASRMGGNRNGQ